MRKLPSHRPSPQIQIRNLKKNYYLGQQAIKVLHDINLDIDEGEFVSIIGPSGSGKSTLLHLIGGLDHPTSGHVLIEDEDLAKFSDAEKSAFRNQKIGFVFQDFHLLENLSVEENLALPFLIQSGKNHLTPREQEQVKEILAELDLTHRAKHHPTEISGGQKQRVAIGRALINQPDIILADEPTGNLDSQTGQQIIDLLTRIHQQRNITLIIITHDQKIASSAQRILQIQDGQITSGRSPAKFTH
jgi:putative ABC transport system ATP-binding protein